MKRILWLASGVVVAAAFAFYLLSRRSTPWGGTVTSIIHLGPGCERRQIDFVRGHDLFRMSAVRLPRDRVTVQLLDLRDTPDRSFEQLLGDTQSDVLINGGYFDERFRPLGLFRIEGNERSATSKALTLSGVVVVAGNGKISLLRRDDAAVSTAPTARQCGPFLIEPGGGLGISSSSVIKAARTVLATSKDGELLLITTSDGALYDVADCLRRYPELLGVASIDRALNLDGGPSSGGAIRWGNFSESVVPRGKITDALAFRILP